MSYRKTFQDGGSVSFADSENFSDTARVAVSRPTIKVNGVNLSVIKAAITLNRNYSFPKEEGCCDPVKQISNSASITLSTLQNQPAFRTQFLLDLLYVMLKTNPDTSIGFVPYEASLEKPATVADIKGLLDSLPAV